MGIFSKKGLLTKNEVQVFGGYAIMCDEIPIDFKEIIKRNVRSLL